MSMGLSDLPKAGQNFHVSLNKIGAPSLQNSIGKMTRNDRRFSNLNKQNISTIVSAIKPVEKAIEKQGGLNKYQVKAVLKRLSKASGLGKGTSAEFTEQDMEDAKKIVAAYKKGQGEATRVKVPFRPYLEDEQNRRGVTSVTNLNNNVASIKSVTDHNGYSATKQDRHTFAGIAGLQNKNNNSNFMPPRPLPPL